MKNNHNETQIHSVIYQCTHTRMYDSLYPRSDLFDQVDAQGLTDVGQLLESRFQIPIDMIVRLMGHLVDDQAREQSIE